MQQIYHIMRKVRVGLGLNMEGPFTNGRVTALVGIPGSTVLLSGIRHISKQDIFFFNRRPQFPAFNIDGALEKAF